MILQIYISSYNNLTLTRCETILELKKLREIIE